MKEDVEIIAPKAETIIEVELTKIQKKYYRAIIERNFSMLSGKGRNIPSLLNVMMQLRKCCNHPFLIQGNSIFYLRLVHHLRNIISRFRIYSEIHFRFCFGCNPHSFFLGVEETELEGVTGQGEILKVLIESSGKLVLIDKLLKNLKEGNHKVLIFSQMVRVLDILEVCLQLL